MEYTLIRSKRKTISIIIDREANIIVKAPERVSLQYIESYVNSKSDWIEKNVRKMSLLAEQRQPKKYDGGEIFMVFGREYSMCISTIDTKIRIVDDKLYFPSRFLNDPKEKMIKWYISIAKKYIIPRTQEIAAQLNLHPEKIKITRADRRWGSCSSKKNINFSYKLAMAGELSIDYVIIHELCHLNHMNHSPNFWATVESVMPDYKKYKKYLKINEHKFVL